MKSFNLSICIIYVSYDEYMMRSTFSPSVSCEGYIGLILRTQADIFDATWTCCAVRKLCPMIWERRKQTNATGDADADLKKLIQWLRWFRRMHHISVIKVSDTEDRQKLKGFEASPALNALETRWSSQAPWISLFWLRGDHLKTLHRCPCILESKQF